MSEIYSETNIRGVRLKIGDCAKILISRYVFYIKIESIGANPFVLLGKDIYGNDVSIDCRKAILVAKMDCENYEKFRKRATGEQ